MLAMELLIKTRKYAKDLQKINYDDYEVLSAINDALRLLAEVSAQTGRAYFRKNTMISNDEEVPSDYIRDSHCFIITEGGERELFRVMNDNPRSGEYTIFGDTFKAGDEDGEFKLMYFYVPNSIMAFSDTVRLPQQMVVPVAKTAAYILQANDDNALTMAQFFLGGETAQASQSKK